MRGAIPGRQSPCLDRYVLVFHADEMVLTKAAVQKFLEGATFRTRLFTDVVLGLSYEHGGYPAFRLQLHRGHPFSRPQAALDELDKGMRD